MIPPEELDVGTPLQRRKKAIERFRRTLLQLESPRLQMMLFVALTGLSGLLASFGLLRLGVVAMWIRYPIAVAFSYLVFLFLLWAWLRQDGGDPHDVGDATNSSDETCAQPVESDGAERWDATDTSEAGEGGSWDGSGLEWAPDTEELGFVLVAIATVFFGLWTVLSIVWGAPALLAELLLDFALAAGLYGRLSKIHGEHWLATAIRRTGPAFVTVAITFTIAGALLQSWAPGARSIGEVVKLMKEPVAR